MTRPLVFIDIETTGLRPDLHEVVEVAWAVGEGPVQSLVLPHLFQNPDPLALKVNRYLDRELYERSTWATADEEDALWNDLFDSTLVGANVRFDAGFLAARHGGEIWHHRLLDVEAYGMAALDLDEVSGLAGLVGRLRDRGFDIPESDHTAANDVLATRAVFRALQVITREQWRAAS